jgi:chromatin remodeling complex protein RSC6
MVRASKTPVSTVIVVPSESQSSENVKVKKVSEKKVKSVTEPVVESVVVTPVSDVENVNLIISNVEGVEVVDNIPTKMNDFSVKLQSLITLLSATKAHFKVLEKVVIREFKISQKASSKKSKRSGNRQPSGFVRPTLISEELALFLGKEIGTEMARTSVSKEINQYIRENQLQDKANGRQINADVKLTKLLKLESGDVLTYFNLQRYMKHHFVKVTPPVVDSVSVTL